MILTSHALRRVNERLSCPPDEAIAFIQQSLFDDGGYFIPPQWYDGENKYITKSHLWINFRDVDGIECSALYDGDGEVIVTVVKNNA